MHIKYLIHISKHIKTNCFFTDEPDTVIELSCKSLNDEYSNKNEVSLREYEDFSETKDNFL